MEYIQCKSCKYKIEEEFIIYHDCEMEEKVKKLEKEIYSVLDDNHKLKIKNIDLKKSIDVIRREIDLSIGQVKSLLETYSHKV